MRTSAPRHRPHSHAGLSVVEVLVALMLVSIGLMGIAGSTALALRTTLDSAHRREAAQRAASRIALLSANGCLRSATGSTTDAARQISEHWTIARPVNGFAEVTDSVSWVSPRGPRSFFLASAITC